MNNKLLIISQYSESQQNEYTYIPPENFKTKDFKISSNKYLNKLNSTSQGISYIFPKKQKILENNNKNYEVSLSSNHNSKEIITYIAPEKKISNNYSIESNPTYNKNYQNGISYIAPKTNNIISKKSKNSFNHKLSTQKNTYTYIAPKKSSTPNNYNIQYINNSDDNNFEISSNKNNFFYLAKNKDNKKEDSDIFKFNHNESMTFICENKKNNKIKNNVITKCYADNFKYIKDDATGAQVLENGNTQN